VESRGTRATEEFFARLVQSTESLLLLDYDGTLAPFQVERNAAYPFPGVEPLLQQILDRRRSRVVIVTGRSIASLQPLLRQSLKIEIWGSHGLEHLSLDGTCRQSAIDPEIASALANAESQFVAAGLGDRLEVKPGGIAIHWRGLPENESERIRVHAEAAMARYAKHPGIKLLAFNGGIEMRVAHPDKGDAVRCVLDSSPANIPVAYLGDDLTDESAFQALNDQGLSVLVRPEYRETGARVWLRPPVELIAFLQRWLDCRSV
jgi:trehalose-phosphatase